MRRERVPVVSQRGRRRRTALARALWNGAEVAVTLGCVLLLLVVHQLWWTNRQARRGAERTVQALERGWGSEQTRVGADNSGVSDSSASAGADDSGAARTAPSGSRGATGAPRPRWDQAYAVLTIPRLGLRVPVAEGVDKQVVLNKGYVGHYKETAQPGQAGNFALAGHRNTHGEPFRYINRLRRGDEVEVETKAAVFTYVVDKGLPQTSPGDGGVIRAVPRSQARAGYGYAEPGYYITLTTCTPEYTSRYRLVVWGKLRSMRPR